MELEGLKELVKLAIREDIGPGDVTSENIFSKSDKAKAVISAKEPGVIAGLGVAELICKEFGLKINTLVKDGHQAKKGEALAEISGSAINILKSERIILNFLSRMSGIATLTKKYIDKVKKYNVRILDTRKTTPAHRELEKHAVRIAGGENHRMGLYDMVLIKDNHIKAAGGIKQAVEKARAKIPAEMKVEVECGTLEQVEQASDMRVDRIMLDNMDIEALKKAVKVSDKSIETEASGNITLDNVEEIAKTGVSCISIGALTHSFKSLDISMEVK